MAHYPVQNLNILQEQDPSLGKVSPGHLPWHCFLLCATQPWLLEPLPHGDSPEDMLDTHPSPPVTPGACQGSTKTLTEEPSSAPYTQVVSESIHLTDEADENEFLEPGGRYLATGILYRKN